MQNLVIKPICKRSRSLSDNLSISLYIFSAQLVKRLRDSLWNGKVVLNSRTGRIGYKFITTRHCLNFYSKTICCRVDRASATETEDLASNPGRRGLVQPKTKNWYLLIPFLMFSIKRDSVNKPSLCVKDRLAGGSLT